MALFKSLDKASDAVDTETTALFKSLDKASDTVDTETTETDRVGASSETIETGRFHLRRAVAFCEAETTEIDRFLDKVLEGVAKRQFALQGISFLLTCTGQKATDNRA